MLASKARSLRRFVSFCARLTITDPIQVTVRVIQDFATHLLHPSARCDSGSHPLAAATRSAILGEVRAFFRFLVDTGELLLDPTEEADFPQYRRSTLRIAAGLPEVLALLEICDRQTAVGLRDRAIVELFFGCGLRRAELVSLDVSDLDLGRGGLHVRHGKGDKSRWIPLVGQARKAVQGYITYGRPELIGSVSEPALIVSNRGRRYNGDSLCQRLRALGERAGIARRITPHLFRHGYATTLLRGGADLASVQKLLGHERADTTQIYTHLVIDDLVAVYRRTHPRERGLIGRAVRSRRNPRTSHSGRQPL